MYPNFYCFLQYAINSCIKASDLPLLSVAAILSLSLSLSVRKFAFVCASSYIL